MSIRLGVAGLTHGHVWGLIDSWANVEGASVELAAVADSTGLLEKGRSRFTRAYTDWREMLDSESLDAVLVTSNNVESSEIAVQALVRGIPCMVEKPMAATAADADRMLKAMEDSGTLLMINWPIAWRPAIRHLASSLESIGHVFHFRMRMGHWGPREIGCEPEFVEWLYDEKLNGGGAIADFCGYGAVMARNLFGMPTSVFAARGNYTKDYDISDDYAVVVLKYPKMSAVLEGTWATKGFDSGPGMVAHGVDGTLAVYEDKRLVRHTPGNAEEIVPTPPQNPESPAEYFVHCMRMEKQPVGILDPVIAADACRIIDAAIKSSKSGCEEKVRINL